MNIQYRIISRDPFVIEWLEEGDPIFREKYPFPIAEEVLIRARQVISNDLETNRMKITWWGDNCYLMLGKQIVCTLPTPVL